MSVDQTANFATGVSLEQGKGGSASKAEKEGRFMRLCYERRKIRLRYRWTIPAISIPKRSPIASTVTSGLRYLPTFAGSCA